MSTAVELPRRFASLVKIEHTVFALPFAGLLWRVPWTRIGSVLAGREATLAAAIRSGGLANVKDLALVHFIVSGGYVGSIVIRLIVLGALAGAIGAGIAASRFLDV